MASVLRLSVGGFGHENEILKSVTLKANEALAGDYTLSADGQMVFAGTSNSIKVDIKTYGETVYGTEAGDVKQQQWGCTTRSGDKLYVHIFELEDEMLYLPLECKVSSAKVFVSGEPVKFEKVAKGVVLNLGKLPAMTDYVVELTTK